LSEELDPIFKALSDPTRRAILDILRKKPVTTTDMVDQFPHLTRFAVMKHMEVLRNVNLLRTRAEGRKRINSLNVIPIRQIYEYWVSDYQDLWASQLVKMKKTLEEDQKQKKV
jgi:DNA-binding transcriptional ArsR family regulator